MIISSNKFSSFSYGVPVTAQRDTASNAQTAVATLELPF